MIIKKPWISEKATDLAALGKYVFLVEQTAARKQLKQTLEKMYGVHIEKVNTINSRQSAKRYKKIVITLKEGEKIDIVPH